MIHGTLLEKKSQPKAYSSSGTLIDGKLGSLSIHADYMIKEENEVSLMGFSDILKSFEILMDFVYCLTARRRCNHATIHQYFKRL